LRDISTQKKIAAAATPALAGGAREDQVRQLATTSIYEM
jgi:hypothetical protein